MEHDPSERYELRGPEYEAVVARLEARRREVEAELEWAPPRHGLQHSSQEAVPCCDPGCQPFPSCCSCKVV